MSTSSAVPQIDWHAKLKAGDALKFSAPPKDREETPSERAARTIPAKWLEELLTTPTTPLPSVRIQNAIIAGALRLRFASFESDFCLIGCELTGRLDLSFTVFKRLALFKSCIFKQSVDFRGARFHSDLMLWGASFQRWARFQEIEVDHALDACYATFGQGIFARAVVKKGAFFKAACFGKEAKHARSLNGAVFLDASFTGAVEFQGSSFKNKANFNRMQVVGSAMFRAERTLNRTTFQGEAIFRNAKVTGNLEFDGTLFESDVFFEGIEIGGSAFFRTFNKEHRTIFAGRANFAHAQFDKEAVFDGAEFRSIAMFDGMQAGRVRFCDDAAGNGNRTTFAEQATFCSATFRFGAEFYAEFKAMADFSEAHFTTLADFTGSKFASKGANFIGSHFERGACFNNAEFGGTADFSASVSERELRFIGTVFSAPVRFLEARSKVVFFGKPCSLAGANGLWQKLTHRKFVLEESASMMGSLDFRGFQYERIYAELDLLFMRLQPFDRQPYSQLENALRLIGEERSAHRAYLERRKQERKLKFSLSSMHHWLLDWIYKLGANYGIRPFRLALAACILIALGVAIFSQGRALVPKDKDKNQNVNCNKLAREVSIHYFLPMDSPLGAECIPTSEIVNVSVPIPLTARSIKLPARPDWYGMALRLFGTILMGIGIAASSGLLRKIAR